jgi:hypothetical protein
MDSSRESSGRYPWVASAPRQFGEGAGDVAADRAVQLPHPLEELLPEMRELDELVLSFAVEVLAGVDTRAPQILVIERELLLKFG